MARLLKDFSFNGDINTQYKSYPFIIIDGWSSFLVSIQANTASLMITIEWSNTGLESDIVNTETLNLTNTSKSFNYSVRGRYVRISIENLLYPSASTNISFSLMYFDEAGSTLDILRNASNQTVEIYKENNFTIRSLMSSDSSILLTQQDDTIDIRTFSNSVGIQSTGSTYSLIYDDVGPTFYFKTLNTTNLNIIDQGTNLLLSNDVINLASTGGNSLVSDGVGPNLSIKGLEAGSFINIIQSDTTLLINGSSSSYETTLLVSVGGGNSIVNNGVGPNLAVKGLIAGSGIILTTTQTNITLTSGAEFNTVYGGIKSNITNILSISPNTSSLIVPNYTSFVSYNMTAINGQLRYLEDVPRIIVVEFDMDIFPTDVNNNLTFSLCRNQTNILDTRKTFTLGGYEHISLQALTSMSKNDLLGIYASHNNAVSTIVQTTAPYYSLIATHQQFASENYITNGTYNIPALGTTAGQYVILNWTVIISPHPNIIFTAPGQYFTVGSTFNATINFTTTIGALTFLRIIKNSIVVYSQTSNANFSTSMSLIAGDILYVDLQRGGGNSTGNFNITFIS